MKNRKVYFLLFFISFPLCLTAQDTVSFFSYPKEFNKKRNAILNFSELGLYGISIAALNQLWYADYPRSNFHFYNDNRAWFQMDKSGHAFTAYNISRAGYIGKKWTGSSDNNSILYGGGLGFVYLTTIEILDGFSREWGASPGDLIANGAGSIMFISQQYFWKTQRIKYKLTYSSTIYPGYRPSLLGSTPVEKILKDYNGQTHWLSFTIEDFFNESSKIPGWFCLSLGYGAEGMTGGESNVDEQGNPIDFFQRRRQYYLSFDIDAERIKTKKKWVRAILIPLSLIKIPAPALSYNRVDKLKVHWMFF